jgi:1,2-phenylacetyl-CoA epoxidase PaaB subunit
MARHVFVRHFDSITLFVLRCAIFRCANGEQRGDVAKISFELTPRHKYGHIRVGLGPIYHFL